MNLYPHEIALQQKREVAVDLYDALLKAAPFVGWASTRGQIIAGVDAVELCDIIDAVLAKAEGRS